MIQQHVDCPVLDVDLSAQAACPRENERYGIVWPGPDLRERDAENGREGRYDAGGRRFCSP